MLGNVNVGKTYNHFQVLFRKILVCPCVSVYHPGKSSYNEYDNNEIANQQHIFFQQWFPPAVSQ